MRLVELLDGHLVLQHQGVRVLLHLLVQVLPVSDGLLLDCPRIGHAGQLGGAGAPDIGRFWGTNAPGVAMNTCADGATA